MNPLLGLNAYLIGTVTAALTTGSVFMTARATGAMSVIDRGVGRTELASHL